MANTAAIWKKRVASWRASGKTAKAFSGLDELDQLGPVDLLRKLHQPMVLVDRNDGFVHGIRHTFAVHWLTRWYRQGVDLHGRLPWLSAYLGHVDLLGTETYLTATPELLALAGDRFRRRYSGRRRTA